MISEDIQKENERFERYKERVTNFSNNFEIGLFIYLLKQSFIIYILIFAAAIASGYLYLRYTDPIYESNLIMQINKKDQAGELLNVYSSFQDNTQLKSEVELLKSSFMLEKAINSMPVKIGYFSKGEVLTADKYKSSSFKILDFTILDSTIINQKVFISINSNNKYILKNEAGNTMSQEPFKLDEFITNKYFSCTFSVTNKESFIHELEVNELYFIFNDIKSFAASVKGNIEVEIEDIQAKTIRIQFKHKNAKFTSDLISMLASEYNKFVYDRQNTSSTNIVQFIASQKDSVDKRLKESERLIQSFQKSNDIHNTEGLPTSILSQIESMESQVVEIEIQNSILGEIRSMLATKGLETDMDAIIPVLIGMEFKSSLNNLIVNLKETIDHKTELLRTITTDNDNITRANNEIRVQIKLIIDAIEVFNNQGNKKLTIFNNKINYLESQLYTLPEKKLELARLDRVLQINNKYYTLLLEKETEYKLSSAGLTTYNEILEEAKAPTIPITPRETFTYLIVFFGALFASVLFAIIKYLMHDQITSLNEIIKLSSATIGILGIIPKYKHNIPISQLIIDKSPKSIMTESFRTIRTNMQFISNKTDAKLIAITSTISGEGKTFIALNLAGIIAFSGKKVIVLDLDMRKPKLHLGFGAENKNGMSTLLIEKDSVENCIRHSDLDGLDFITAGPIPPNPSELIINGKLDRLIEKLKLDYDMIVTDNPPVGLVTDGIPIIQRADYPIYIFKANYSKKNFIQNVDRIINENNVPNLSVILNSVDVESKGYGYNYGYGYGYGYGYDYGSSSTYGGYYTDEASTIEKTGFFNKLFKKRKK
jgi:capsular exopolysaccharide synthesis family protein